MKVAYDPDKKIQRSSKLFADDSKEIMRLTLGKEYRVFAVGLSEKQVFVFIEDDDYSGIIPVPYDLALLVVTDASLNPEWIIGGQDSGTGSSHLITFPEWAHDPEFYRTLVEGERKGREIELVIEWRNRMAAVR